MAKKGKRKIAFVGSECYPFVKTGGLGGEIAASVAESDAFYYLDAPIRRLAAEDVPVPFSAVLEKGVLPDEEKIAAAVREEAG